jgi:sulfur-carrier protein
MAEKGQNGMAVRVIVPAQLRQYTGDQSTIEVDGGTVDEVLASLDKQLPGIRDRICEPDGRLRRFVNVFVNGEDVRALDGIETETNDGDEVGIVPAVAGGQRD